MKRTTGIAVVLAAIAIFTTTAFKAKFHQPFSIDKDQGTDPIIVLELFTSQGCSSCPPADELLARIKRESTENIIALSYHVDYWNYIGWEDPFSHRKYSARQGRYNKKFRYHSNYTPQLVVNGKEHFVGSDASILRDRINFYRALQPENRIEISGLSKSANSVSVQYEVDGPITGKLLRAILVIDNRTTLVRRGENRNRKLTNYNIVVAEVTEELQKPHGSISVSIPQLVNPDDKLQLIVLTETVNQDITGADKSGFLQ